ncbi:MAG: Flp pilus assembly protein CpaB [Solirubrobacterales bacterium]
MTEHPRRIATLTLAAALVCGVAAAWLVSGYTDSLRRVGGNPVSVLVAAEPIPRGTLVDSRFLETSVGRRIVPAAYAPVDVLDATGSLSGARASIDIPAGGYLTSAAFSSAARGAGYRLRADERAVTIDARVAPGGTTLPPGQRVDVLVSGLGGGSTTTLVLSGAEVLAVGDQTAGAESGDGSGEPAGAPGREVTLRATVDQATVLTRADAFAKEIRLLVRP